MKRFGLIGHPLSHSLSPKIHGELFIKNNISAIYELIDVADLSEINIYDYDGLNVTIPYKEKIIPLLKSLSPPAEEYGAVNCICDGIGYNTDVYGFVNSLPKKEFGKVLILGYGGAAKMAVSEMQKISDCVYVATRREVDVQNNVNLADIPAFGYDILINATPVGMFPKIDECPVPREVIERCEIVFDLIYNPPETRLLSVAREMGKTVVNGMKMLYLQAEKSQEIWLQANA
ncbi:MAG: shikimate dehydrogenase [Ruminococcus sp.]|jgi:shikimate dehydrogenase|nr:shikimate dehydrogenase [Ruminococcus sp.]